MNGAKILFFCMITGMAVFSCNETGEQVSSYAGAQWIQDAYIKASNSNCNHYFGYAVAAGRDTLVVGAYHEDSGSVTIVNADNGASFDSNATDSGAVYVYKKKGNDWVQDAYIKASNGEAYDYFGYSVAVNGDYIVVGAYHEDSSQTNITNTDNAASSDNAAIDSGAAYVFKKTDDDWVQDAYLKASNAESGDCFGFSVSISEQFIVVGAYHEGSDQRFITNTEQGAAADNNAPCSGAAYVFKKVNDNWVQDAYLKASNADENDNFGDSVAVYGGIVVVGARYEDSAQAYVTNQNAQAGTDNSCAHSGAAYVFIKRHESWVQETYLKASNADAYDYYGHSVAVYGDTLIVGAYDEDSSAAGINSYDGSASDNNDSEQSGAVYVFRTF